MSTPPAIYAESLERPPIDRESRSGDCGGRVVERAGGNDLSLANEVYEGSLFLRLPASDPIVAPPMPKPSLAPLVSGPVVLARSRLGLGGTLLLPKPPRKEP